MSLLLVLIKGTALLGLTALVGLLLRPVAARSRRLVLATAVVGALSLPFLSALLPAWGVLPRAVSAPLTVAEDVLVSVPVEAADAGEVIPSGEVAAVALPSSVGVTAGEGGLGDLLAGVTWLEALLALWVLGALLLLSRLLVGLAATVKLRRGLSRRPSALWSDSLEEAVELLELGPRSVSLRLSSAAAVPTVVGMLTSTILLPLEAEGWGAARRRVVLLHELAHVKHHDNVLSLLGQLLCVIHWYNPLAWWLVSRLSIECEHAADDAVLEVGTPASDYAFELVRLARDGRRSLSMASAMARPAELRSRVTRILDARRRRRSLSPVQQTLFGALALTALVALSCVAAEGERSELAALERDEGVESPLVAAVAEYYGVLPDGVELTIDEPLQVIVDDEVRSLVERYNPRMVSVVALDPCNGHVLALGSHGEGESTAIRAVEPGSTMKPLTIAAALEEGMATDARFFCEGGLLSFAGGQVLRDAHPAGWLGVGSIVARSSNIGTGRIYQQELGWGGLQRWFRQFHLAEPTQVQLRGAEAGVIPQREGSAFRGVLAANGVGLRTSPLQLAAAYAALANHGVYHAPTLARRVRDPEGRTLFEAGSPGQVIVSDSTARAVVAMLQATVDDDEGTGRAARVEGLSIAGKTGTVQLQGVDDDEFYASFVGIVEPDEPQVVILVGVEGVQGDIVSGGQVAAPAFARIVSRARAAGARIE